MAAGALFFFGERSTVKASWQTSLTVAALVCFVAFWHYMYMRDVWVATGESPTVYRYIDWLITVPMQIVEFYLILAKAGATKSLMWKLILWSTVMLVFGYVGEAIDRGNAALWGGISGAAYFYVVYLIWLGEAKALAEKAGGAVLEAHNALCWFVLVGWSIYPIGYMIGTDGWYDFIDAIPLDMDVVYNIGDAINKIGFGLVIYNLAVSK